MAKSSTDVTSVTLDLLNRLNLTVHFSLNVSGLRTFLVPVSAHEGTIDVVLFPDNQPSIFRIEQNSNVIPAFILSPLPLLEFSI